MTTTWDQINPWATIGGTPTAPSSDVVTGGLGQAAIRGTQSIAHPDHPFFWFGLIALVTVGAAGASTHLRVGPFRVSGSAGRS